MRPDDNAQSGKQEPAAEGKQAGAIECRTTLQRADTRLGGTSPSHTIICFKGFYIRVVGILQSGKRGAAVEEKQAGVSESRRTTAESGRQTIESRQTSLKSLASFNKR